MYGIVYRLLLMAHKLTCAEVDALLPTVSKWSRRDHLLERTFVFVNFIEAMRFANEIANTAEDVQHHPDMLITYNRVTLGYSTHDAQGLSAKDFEAARVADGIYQRIAAH